MNHHKPLAWALALALCLTTQAQTLTFNKPEADSYLLSAEPGKNFGQSSVLQVRKADNRRYSRMAYIRFNLANLLQAPVAEATLTFHLGSIYRNRSQPNTILVYGWLGDTWSESSLTDENAHWKARDADTPPADVTLLGSFPVLPSGHAYGGTPYTLTSETLAAFLDEARLTGKNHVTFILTEKETSTNVVTFTSRQNPSFPATSLSITLR